MVTPDKIAKMSKDLAAIIKWVDAQECKTLEAPVAQDNTAIEERLDALEKLIGAPGKKRKTVCDRLSDLEKSTK